MSNPKREYWPEVKWIFQYLKGTLSVVLHFDSSNLEGYTGSNISADVDTSRSTSRYVMTYAGGDVSWQSSIWLQQKLARK